MHTFRLFVGSGVLSAAIAVSVVADAGDVACFGNNSFGQCDVPGGLSNAVDLSVGPTHTLYRELR